MSWNDAMKSGRRSGRARRLIAIGGVVLAVPLSACHYFDLRCPQPSLGFACEVTDCDDAEVAVGSRPTARFTGFEPDDPKPRADWTFLPPAQSESELTPVAAWTDNTDPYHPYMRPPVAHFDVDVPGRYEVGVQVTFGGEQRGCAPVEDLAVVTGVELMANAGPDQEVPVGTEVAVDGSASAPSKEWASYTWRRTRQANISGLSTAPAHVLDNETFTFTLNEPDELEYELTVRAGPVTQSDAVIVRSAPPVIGSIDPPSGPIGWRVRIEGENFSPTPNQNVVTFHGALQTAPVVTASITALEVDVPVGATSGPIEVTVVGTGDQATADFVVTGLAADAGPDQQVDVGTDVTLDGSGSAGGIQSYSWSLLSQSGQSGAPASGTGVSLMFTLDDPDELVYELTVSDGVGNATDQVVVRSTPPTISTFDPTSGVVGTQVTIKGTNFSRTTQQNEVQFNTVSATVTSASPTYDQLIAEVPATATTGPVTVKVLGTGDDVASTQDFVVLATGAIELTTVTSGADLDSDGYTVLLDGNDQGTIGANAVLTVTDLTEGEHTVELTGLNANCGAADNPRTVTVQSGATEAITFDVTCFGAIAYQVNGGISAIGADGDNNGIREITAEGRDPAWSPDGTLLALARGIPTQIAVANANGQNLHDVTQNTAGSVWPAWSPDGTQIVYTRVESDGYQDIWLISVDGSTTPQNLTATAGQHDRSPDWSPLGSPPENADKIVFVRFLSGLMLMDPDGANVTSLNTQTDDEAPAWSPDGVLIAFSRRVAQFERQIYLINPVSKAETPLTSGAFDTDPSWSADGAFIVFNRDGSVATLNVATKAVTVLTAGDAGGANPSWRH